MSFSWFFRIPLEPSRWPGASHVPSLNQSCTVEGPAPVCLAWFMHPLLEEGWNVTIATQTARTVSQRWMVFPKESWGPVPKEGGRRWTSITSTFPPFFPTRMAALEVSELGHILLVSPAPTMHLHRADSQ